MYVGPPEMMVMLLIQSSQDIFCCTVLGGCLRVDGYESFRVSARCVHHLLVCMTHQRRAVGENRNAQPVRCVPGTRYLVTNAFTYYSRTVIIL